MRRRYSSANILPLQVIVNEDNSRDTADFIQKRLSAIKNQRSTGELEDLALVIGQRAHEINSYLLTPFLCRRQKSRFRT